MSLDELESQTSSVHEYSKEEIEYIKKHGKDRTGRLADVYTVKFDTVPDTPIATVENMVESIRASYLKLRKRGKSDEDIRKLMCEADKHVEYFANTSHPQLFKTLTDGATDDRVMQGVLFLIKQKRKVKEGKITNQEATENCQEFCLNKYKGKKKPR